MIFKDIHIGELIAQRVIETNVNTSRICNFFNCTEEEINHMYQSENLSTDILLRWCKLLGYDFFRIYSHHLTLYAPISKAKTRENTVKDKPQLPQFRKNIYTQEVIHFILDLIEKKEKTVLQIINEYHIPKTTLYKWMKKYKP